jgi:hypothetical protein
MDKYEFISDLLERDHMQAHQRERILLLTAKEIEKDRKAGLDIEERVRRLEYKIERNNDLPPNPEEDLIDVIEVPNPEYLDPSALSNFLSEFNKHRILSTTSHEIDRQTLDNLTKYMKSDKYNFRVHMELVKNSFYNLKKAYPNVNKYIFKRIKRYLLEDLDDSENSGWSNDRISLTWKSKALEKWAEENPGIPPNLDTALSNELGSSGFDDFQPIKTVSRRIKNMCDLVNHFKNTIRINYYNNLIDIFSSINGKYDWCNKMVIELNQENIITKKELFTDVDKLKQCYRSIMQMAYDTELQYGNEKHHVIVGFHDKGNECILSIHHVNSVFTKKPDDLISRLGQSHSLLKEKVIGMCDLYLKADFGDSVYAIINIVDKYKMYVRKIPEFKGVEHILIFKR